MTDEYIPYAYAHPQTNDRDGLTWLMWGGALFFALTLVFVAALQARADDDVLVLIIGTYIFVHVLNGTAAWILLRTLWGSVRHILAKMYIGICGLTIGVFALTSGVDLLNHLVYALSASGTVVFNFDFFILVIWWLLLPLQVLAWLLLTVFQTIHRRVARKKNQELPVSRRANAALYWFVLLSVCAVGVMLYAMDTIGHILD